jgi:hypothetical protein
VGGPVDFDDPPIMVPFSESDPFDPRRLYRPPERIDPANLVRVTYPPSIEHIDNAAEFRRRRPHKRR